MNQNLNTGINTAREHLGVIGTIYAKSVDKILSYCKIIRNLDILNRKFFFKVFNKFNKIV